MKYKSESFRSCGRVQPTVTSTLVKPTNSPHHPCLCYGYCEVTKNYLRIRNCMKEPLSRFMCLGRQNCPELLCVRAVNKSKQIIYRCCWGPDKITLRLDLGTESKMARLVAGSVCFKVTSLEIPDSQQKIRVRLKIRMRFVFHVEGKRHLNWPYEEVSSRVDRCHYHSRMQLSFAPAHSDENWSCYRKGEQNRIEHSHLTTVLSLVGW